VSEISLSPREDLGGALPLNHGGAFGVDSRRAQPPRTKLGRRRPADFSGGCVCSCGRFIFSSPDEAAGVRPQRMQRAPPPWASG